jgi:transcriptional antiterminator Rof (Rho-off)
MSDNYQPVSCQLHSEIELFAMKGISVKIETGSAELPLIGRIIDISIHDKAEYIIVKTASQQTLEIRLDRILGITAA